MSAWTGHEDRPPAVHSRCVVAVVAEPVEDIVAVVAAHNRNFAAPCAALFEWVVCPDNKPLLTRGCWMLRFHNCVVVERQEPDIGEPARIAVRACIAVAGPLEAPVRGPGLEPARQAKMWRQVHFVPDMSVAVFYTWAAHIAWVLPAPAQLAVPKVWLFCWQMVMRSLFAPRKQ